MTDAEIVAGITAGTSLIVALGSGGFTIWNTGRTNANATQLQDYKSAFDRDLARLNAKLTHGQLISSTQWNAEFNAYQALWKSIVPVRSIAHKIVMRDDELDALGLEDGDVSEKNKVENIDRLLKRYADAVRESMFAINEHAPFYAAGIRKRANEVHGLAHVVWKTNTVVLVARMKGKLLSADQALIAEEERRQELKALFDGVDSIEEMIRARMADVRVFNPVIA